jgi:hypothetical protein
MAPCTTVVYETADDDLVHARHFSTTKSLRDLGCGPDGSEAAVDDLVELTGEYMSSVWANIERHAEDREEAVGAVPKTKSFDPV